MNRYFRNKRTTSGSGRTIARTPDFLLLFARSAALPEDGIGRFFLLEPAF
ncbi:hypothetical protein [Paenibacillus humicola]|nr:hypothetical protein [Paenibacillus humicola]